MLVRGGDWYPSPRAISIGYCSTVATATTTDPKVRPTPRDKATVADSIFNIPTCISFALISHLPRRLFAPLILLDIAATMPRCWRANLAIFDLVIS